MCDKVKEVRKKVPAADWALDGDRYTNEVMISNELSPRAGIGARSLWTTFTVHTLGTQGRHLMNGSFAGPVQYMTAPRYSAG